MTMQEQKQSLQRDDYLPSTLECSSHLRLMTAFAYLKEDISETKDLFFQDALLSQDITMLSDARWTIFVARAASRYEKWYLNLANKQSTPPLCTNVLTSQPKLDRYLAAIKPLEWTPDMLPPLDVLMVLHAAMLNPRWFAEDCLRHGLMALWKAGMPWQLISECIDEKTFEYKPSPNTVSHFEAFAGLSWDNVNDDEVKLFDCAICGKSTVPDEEQYSMEKWISSEERTSLCRLPCRKQEHLEQLKIIRLEKDLRAFHVDNKPLRGTILDDKGLILSDSSLRPQRNFCGRLFSGTPLPALESGSEQQTITAYFKNLDAVTKNNRFSARRAKQNPLSSTLTASERYAFERAKLSYSENTTDFSIDLAAAVVRQGTFVQQMRHIDWTHAPGLDDILSDLIDRYEIFLQIMRSSALSEFSVPTLAVDLAWHTHQLSPARYYHYDTQVLHSAFFDHDDRVGEGDLTPAFERTSARYKQMTDGMDYSECLCWHCAAQNEVRALDPDEQLSGHELDVKARELVRDAQAKKFDHDFDRLLKKGKVLDRADYVKSYTWLYPEMAPSIAVGG